MSVFGPVIKTKQPQQPVLGSAIDSHGRGPTLDLNFINGAPLDSRITLTRASTATYFDVTGVRQTAAINAPRLEFDPSTHAPRGFLIEEARTNSLLNSGTPATQTTASLVAGTYTLWVEGSGTATSSAGTAVGSGFGAATAGSPNVFTTTGAGTVTVTVSGSLTLFQLENGPFATSYIATAAATVTRAKDNLVSLPVGSWFSSAASGALVAEGLFLYGPVNANVAYLAQIGDNTSNNNIQLRRLAASNNVAAVTSVGGVTKLNATVGALTPGSVAKAGVAWGAPGSVTAINGAAGPSSATAVSLAGVATTLNIGFNGIVGAFQTDGYVRRIRYWPRMLSQGELNQVTL